MSRAPEGCTCAYDPEMTNWHLPSCPLAGSDDLPETFTLAQVKQIVAYANLSGAPSVEEVTRNLIARGWLG